MRAKSENENLDYFGHGHHEHAKQNTTPCSWKNMEYENLVKYKIKS